jgi:hypothetical protein
VFCQITQAPYEAYTVIVFFIVGGILFLSNLKIKRRLAVAAPATYTKVFCDYERGDSIFSAIPKSFEFFIFLLSGRYFSLGDAEIRYWGLVNHALTLFSFGIVLALIIYGC